MQPTTLQVVFKLLRLSPRLQASGQIQALGLVDEGGDLREGPSEDGEAKEQRCKARCWRKWEETTKAQTTCFERSAKIDWWNLLWINAGNFVESCCDADIEAGKVWRKL